MKEKYLLHQVAKWRSQVTNPKFSSANPAVQARAHVAYEHWSRMLEYVRDVQARRVANRTS